MVTYVLTEYTRYTVARFDANSDRANLNCNRDPDNSNSSLGIAHLNIGVSKIVLLGFKFQNK